MSQSRWWCSNIRRSEAASPAAVPPRHTRARASVIHRSVPAVFRTRCDSVRCVCQQSRTSSFASFPRHSVIRPRHIGTNRLPHGRTKRGSGTWPIDVSSIDFHQTLTRSLFHAHSHALPDQLAHRHLGTFELDVTRTNMNKKRKKLFKNLAIYFDCLNTNECAAQRARARSKPRSRADQELAGADRARAGMRNAPAPVAADRRCSPGTADWPWACMRTRTRSGSCAAVLLLVQRIH
jgi:hypothetical protein